MTARAKGRTMPRKLVEPTVRSRADAQGGLLSFTRASPAPSMGLPIDPVEPFGLRRPVAIAIERGQISHAAFPLWS